MKRNIVMTTVVAAVTFVVVSRVEAQLFGNRTLGRSLARRSTTGGGSVGTVTGSERFVRRNRGRSDFIGTDSRDRRGFVGTVQGDTRGTVRSATSGLRIETSSRSSANLPRAAPSKTGMYEPRLVVRFTFQRPEAATLSSKLAHRLDTSGAIRHLGSIEVSVAERTATLRGVVASERDRRMAELLVLFEPGISAVSNELTLSSSSEPRNEDSASQ